MAKKSLKETLKGVKLPPKKRFKLRPEILLHPNIPKPMHGCAPRNVMPSKWWNETRKKAYAKTGNCCIACGIAKAATKRGYLEVHEVYKINYAKGIMKFVEAVALCSPCHNFIHDGRLSDLMRKGIINQATYVNVIQHGQRVLADAGLSRGSHADRDALILSQEMAEWGDWRLVIGRQKFEPKFKSYDEWEKAIVEGQNE